MHVRDLRARLPPEATFADPASGLADPAAFERSSPEAAAAVAWLRTHLG